MLNFSLNDIKNDFDISADIGGWTNGAHDYEIVIEVGEYFNTVSGKLYSKSPLSPLEIAEMVLTSLKEKFEEVE